MFSPSEGRCACFSSLSPLLETHVLPYRPEDDGSFRRRENRRDQDDDFQASRGDADNNWRRGGGGGGASESSSFRDGGTSSFRDDRRGAGFDDRASGSRSGGFDRGGSGGSGFDDNRGSSFDRRGGGYDSNSRSGFDRSTRSGGYDNRDRGGGYDRSGRGGGAFDDNRGVDSFDRRGAGSSGGFDDRRSTDDRPPAQASIGGSRPRLQLKARTTPLPQEKVEAVSPIGKAEESDLPSPPQETSPGPVVVSDGDDQPVTESSEANQDEKVADTETPKDDKVAGEGEEKKLPKKREPEVVNSRAAALEAAPAMKNGVRKTPSLQWEFCGDQTCSYTSIAHLILSFFPFYCSLETIEEMETIGRTKGEPPLLS